MDSILAPISSSGSMMRRIGRVLKDSSPINSAAKSCPASTPARIRIVDPLLPQSNGSRGATSSDYRKTKFSLVLLDRDAQAPQTVERRRTVTRGGKVCDLRRTVGERRDQCGAMGDGFVAGQA